MRTAWCLIFMSIGVVCGKNIYDLVIIPKAAGEEISKASLDCVKSMNLDEDIMRRYFAWELEDSEIVRRYIFCFGNKSGYIDDNGHIAKDKLLQVVGPHTAKVAAVVEECNKLNKYSDKYETVFRTVMCFKEKSGLELRVA